MSHPGLAAITSGSCLRGRLLNARGPSAGNGLIYLRAVLTAATGQFQVFFHTGPTSQSASKFDVDSLRRRSIKCSKLKVVKEGVVPPRAGAWL
jgi:hypothetical protein